MEQERKDNKIIINEKEYEIISLFSCDTRLTYKAICPFSNCLPSV